MSKEKFSAQYRHMNRSFVQHNHGARIDTKMHRATVIESEDCAPEGGELPDAWGPITSATPAANNSSGAGWVVVMVCVLLGGLALANLFGRLPQ